MTTSPADPTPNPYVGPRTFTYEQRRFFFGREREARDLLARVVSERLLLFYAQSGAGKSSLLHTRLIPQLREEEGFFVLPVGRVSGTLPHGVADVDNIYLFNLMTSLDMSDADPARLAHITFRDFLAQLASEDGLHWAYEPTSAEEAAPTTTTDTTGSRYVLIIDQFEEIITTHSDRWREREGFFRQVNEAMLADPALWVVLTLREDYVAALDPYAQCVADKLRARFYMERMGINAALEAIHRPAELGGRPFAAGVAEALVDNLRQLRSSLASTQQRAALLDNPQQGAALPDNPQQSAALLDNLQQRAALLGQYIEPVQLQVVCYQLWERLRTRPLAPITADDLQQSGDVDSALAAFYEEAIASVLGRAEATLSERQLRTWFDTKLITEAGTRGTVYQGQTETAGLPNAVVRLLVDQFLLRTELRAGGAWVELVHDRFVEPITKSNRAWLSKNQNPLTVAALAWHAANQPAAQLYRDQQLADALAQLEKNPDQFGDQEREFVRAGQRAEEQRKALLQRTWSLAAGLVILVAIGLTSWALWNAYQAGRARDDARQQAGIAATAEAEAKQDAQAAAVARADALTAQATAVAAEAVANRSKESNARTARAGQLTIKSVQLANQSPQTSLLLAIESVHAQQRADEPVLAAAEENLRSFLRHPPSIPLRGHEDDVTAVVFSPDGKWLASASYDKSVRLWNAAQPTADPIVLTDHKNGIHNLVFSPDGKWLAGASNDNSVRLWNIAQPTADPIILRDHEDRITDIAFSPDGKWLASASMDYAVRLWPIEQPGTEPIVLRGHENAVYALVFSPDGKRLASVGHDDSTGDTVRLWNIEQPTAAPVILHGQEYFGSHSTPIVVFSPDGKWLASAGSDDRLSLWNVAQPTADPISLGGIATRDDALAFSPDSKWLAGAGADNTVRLWDVEQPTADPVVLRGHEAWVSAVAFSPDGKWLASASADTTVRLWDVEQPTADPIVLRGHEYDVTAIAFSPDGRWLASASVDNTVRLWHIDQASADPIVLPGYEDAVTILGFSLDGKWLAGVGYEERTVQLRNVEQPTADPVVLRGHEGWVTAVVFSPDGKWLASASNDTTVRLWDVEQPTADPVVLRGHEDGIRDVAFSPDGKWLASASGDDTARLWNIEQPTADPVVLRGHEDWVSVVAFSPDGRWLASASGDGTVRLWNIEQPGTDPIVLYGHEDGIYSLAFSPAGKWLASASHDNSIRLWEVEQPTVAPVVLSNSKSPFITKGIVFSPDGRWLASADDDQSVRLWQMEQPGTDPVILRGHGQNITAIVFSPNGRRLASIGYDNSLYLWNMGDLAADPVLLYSPLVSHYTLYAAAFSPDGMWLASASQDNSVSLWLVTAESLIAATCDASARNLSWPEWEKYFPGASYATTCPQLPVHPTVLALGQELAAEGKLTEASEFYHTMVVMDPEHPFVPEARARVEYGDVLAAGGQITEAITFYEEALTLDGSLHFIPEAQAHLIYGRALKYRLRYNGNLNEAILELETAHKLDPSPDFAVSLDLAELYQIQGATLAASGLISEAVAAFTQAITFDPLLDIKPLQEAQRLAAPKIVELGTQLARSGDIDGAIARYQQALAYDPALYLEPRVRAQLEYGLALYDKHAYAQAMRAFAAAQAINPALDITNTLSASDWGEFCHGGSLAGVAAVVMPACERAVALEPRNANLRNSRGLARALTGDLPGAAADFAFYTVWAKDNPDAADPAMVAKRQAWISALRAGVNPARAGVAASLGKIDEAIGIYAALQTTNPAVAISAEEWNNLCWNGALHGEAAQVLDACDQAVALAPENGNYLDSRAFARAATGDIAGASKDFAAYLVWAPGHRTETNINQRKNWLAALKLGVNPVRAYVLARNRQIDEALALYGALEQADPSLQLTAEEWNNLCWYGAQSGYATRVFFACELAVALAPDNGNFHDSRGLARALTGDIQGAIEDFEFALQWARRVNEWEEFIVVRNTWLLALRLLQRFETDQ